MIHKNTQGFNYQFVPEFTPKTHFRAEWMSNRVFFLQVIWVTAARTHSLIIKRSLQQNPPKNNSMQDKAGSSQLTFVDLNSNTVHRINNWACVWFTNWFISKKKQWLINQLWFVELLFHGWMNSSGNTLHEREMSHTDVWSIHAIPEGGIFRASIETRKPKNKTHAL